jgi:hypothetical protein
VWLHTFVTTALSTVRFTPGKNPLTVGIEVGVGPHSRSACFYPNRDSDPNGSLHSLYRFAIAASMWIGCGINVKCMHSRF